MTERFGGLLGRRPAIGLAGVLLPATPLLLPRRAATPAPSRAARENRVLGTRRTGFASSRST
ncbi:hypothetical protein [Streptomyces sp. NRRL WC-3744]|uniref:hypothetical protein n=1 Tax=Streptomyces sp. NRRL WC-3744 TaxID=1463935 RepID=UPI0004C626B2|nr:hypothetical protein [Streptomyces sp. NRRL WC-3744]